MNRASGRSISSLAEVRVELAAHLRERFSEIEESILARVRSVFETDESDDLEYRAGLRAAVAESVNFALLVIERGEEPEPMPAGAAAQARRAARNGIRLDTLLRRYAAGERRIAEFIMEEAERLPGEAVRQILRAQGPHVDRLMASVAAEYMDELELMKRSPTQRLAERVQRLLEGDAPLDIAELEYEFGGWHLGMVVSGDRAEAAVRTLAAGINRQALVVPRGGRIAWAWLGGRRALAVSEVERFAGTGILGDVTLALGESRRGLNGWRLTHHEAQAARLVMLRRPQKVTRASDVILLAAVLSDDALARSLYETYLAPLDEQGDSGVLRETLRAYFAAGFNAATAAAALKVDRHTVQRRLRKVEEALGRLIHTCHAELEVALSLEGFSAKHGLGMTAAERR